MKSTSQRRWIWGMTVLGLCVFGGSAYYVNRATSSVSSHGGGQPASASTGKAGFEIGVEAITVKSVVFHNEANAVGSLKSNQSVVLRPEIAGRVAAIRFQDGVKVTHGSVLISLDASTQAAELQQAKANLALAKANYERTKDLSEKKFVSARALDESVANLKVLEAAVALAQAHYQKTQLRAPYTGIVGIRNVAVGDYVKEGQDLVNIEDISTLKVDFRLPETLLTQLQRGQTLSVTTDVLQGETFNAAVDAIDPLIDATGRAVLLRARLGNPELKLRPGMFVRVKLTIGDDRNVPAVPEQALVPSGSNNFVFKIIDGKAQRAEVKIGQRHGTMVEVLDGVNVGEQVVTAGQLKLRNGVPVRQVQTEAAQ